MVYGALKRRIVTGMYDAGQPLSQLVLAREFGISRTPLREVFRLLERDGLIVASPNKRFRVAAFSPDDLEQLYVLRISVEGPAARYSVPRLQASDLSTMTSLLTDMDAAVADEAYDDWQTPHAAFHRHLLLPSGDRILELTDRLSEHAERYRFASSLPISPTSWAQSHADHHELLKAAHERHGGRAAERLAIHYGRVALSALSISAPLHDPQMLRAVLKDATSDNAIA